MDLQRGLSGDRAPVADDDSPRRLEDRLRTLRSRHVPAADELATDDAEYRLVLAATAQLADNDAEVLRLAAWERLSTDAIAAILGIEPTR